MPVPNDPLLPLQWYINRSQTPSATIDLNIFPVWDGGGGRSYTGAGVHVGVFDSLIQVAHPDLAANIDTSLQVDGLDYLSTASGHGTCVAGIIAAANNGIGVTGIAYGSQVTSVPVLFSNTVSLQNLGIALPHMQDFDVVNMSFGGVVAFDDFEMRIWWQFEGHYYADAAAEGRGGLGTVLVAASGNNRMELPTDANLSHFQNDRHVITVGAVNPQDTIASFSSEGANLLVVAPSYDAYYGVGVATTDQAGSDGFNPYDYAPFDPVSSEYTTKFGGTSAAAPMVSAIVALMLEANPGLGWRDVREILALSARHAGTDIGGGIAAVYPERDHWVVNGAHDVNGGGFHFSNDYGFGVVDATAAVRLAETWVGTRTSDNEVSRTASVTGDQAIPEGGEIRLTFDIAAGMTAENVTLFLDISARLANQLEVVLISPDGTQSVMFNHRGEGLDIYGQGGSSFQPWTFDSNAFLGEDPTGTWTVVISKFPGGDYNTPATLHSATLSVYGEAAKDDNVYFYTNEFGQLAGMDPSFTLSDAKGDDTIDAAAVTAAMTIDLTPGHVSHINGQAVTIATGTTIENAIGGDGGDVITGNAAVNNIQGMRGNDTIDGRAGDDTLDGGAGNDALFGRDGTDTLIGGEGDDVLIGGAGNDVLMGGDGRDRASYADATAAVSLSLYKTVQVTVMGSDILTGIEDLEGSRFNDILIGDANGNRLLGGDGNDSLHGGAGIDMLFGGAGNDNLDGGDGNDTLRGGAGVDILHGGGGIDMADYADSSAGVKIDLSQLDLDAAQGAGDGAAIGHGGDAEGDRLFTIENLQGSAFADALSGGTGVNALWGGDGDDVLSGNSGGDTLYGQAGNDTLNGGSGDDVLYGGGGADTLRGGDGTDMANYSDSGAAVTVNLTADGTGLQSAAGGTAQGDQLYSIENVRGSVYADSLTGDGGVNRLWGGLGDDVEHGGGGGDFLYGEAGNDTLDGGDGEDTLMGGAGADILMGGNGADTVDYSDSNAAVTVSLVAGAGGLQAASGGTADGDQLYGIERVRGSHFNDTLTGDDGDNQLRGGDGNDVENGGGGTDYLYGDDGNDVLDGGAGNDVIDGGSGADILHGGSGTDALNYAASNAAVTVSLAADSVTGQQSVSGGTATGDMVYGFEDVRGSNFADTLTGDGGRNVLMGNGGADILKGGGGDDVFRYSDSDLTHDDNEYAIADRILDFHVLADPATEHDVIDLRGIDAIPGGSDDAFTFIGQAAFTAIGQVRVTFDGTNTVVQVNTVDDTFGGAIEYHPEMIITLAGINVAATIGAGDFLL